MALLVVGIGCEKSPPATQTNASPSASASTSALPDDRQTPQWLCARLTLLHNKVHSQIAPIDPRMCIEKFTSAREIRPDLYPCLSLCVMRSDDYPTAAQCSGMCAPVENTCKDLAEKQAVCVSRLKAVQADPQSKTIACVARCGQKFDKMPDVVDCMGAECGL